MSAERGEMDELAKAMGFDDEAEFHRMIAAVDLDDLATSYMFLRWKQHDGSRAGLALLKTKETR